MTTTQLKPTNLAALRDLAAIPGPCVTVLLPDSHPGAPEGTRKVQFKNLLRDLHEQEPWIGPDSADRLEEEHGGRGVAIFLTPQGYRAFPHSCGVTHATAASHPYVLPLIAEAHATADLYVLDLNKKHLRLFQYTDGACHPLALPAGLPHSLEATTHHNHSIPPENRTSGGPGSAGVRFGTSGERESAHSDFEHFCALVDRGLATLPTLPLLLMGVREEIAAFRRVSHAAELLQTEVDGNASQLNPPEIATRAREAALAHYRRTGAAVLAEFREMRNRTLTLGDPPEILVAAAAGRVHELVLREGAEVLAILNPEIKRARASAEDLLNAAAVETLRHGGDVYVVPPGDFPNGKNACAVLRY